MSENVKTIVEEFVNQQGHSKCWYYPDLFNRLAALLGIKARASELPSRAEFEQGCTRYQNEVYLSEKIMSYGELSLEEIETIELIKELRRRQNAVRVMRCPYCNVPLNVEGHSCKFKDDQSRFTEGLDKIQVEGPVFGGWAKGDPE